MPITPATYLPAFPNFLKEREARRRILFGFAVEPLADVRSTCSAVTRFRRTCLFGARSSPTPTPSPHLLLRPLPLGPDGESEERGGGEGKEKNKHLLYWQAELCLLLLGSLKYVLSADGAAGK